MCEEDAGLVAPRAKLQHGRQQLRRLTAAQGLHPKKKGDTLIIVELVGLQQPLLEGRVGMMARRVLHHVQDKADGLLGEGCHQIIVPSLLPGDAMKPESALSRYKPTSRFIHPDGRKTEATQALYSRLSGKIDEVFLVHLHRGHQCKEASKRPGCCSTTDYISRTNITCAFITVHTLADFLRPRPLIFSLLRRSSQFFISHPVILSF
jgi:hypothetical protein